MIISHLYTLLHYLNEPEVDTKVPAGGAAGWRHGREGCLAPLGLQEAPVGLLRFHPVSLRIACQSAFKDMGHEDLKKTVKPVTVVYLASDWRLILRHTDFPHPLTQ